MLYLKAHEVRTALFAGNRLEFLALEKEVYLVGFIAIYIVVNTHCSPQRS